MKLATKGPATIFTGLQPVLAITDKTAIRGVLDEWITKPHLVHLNNTERQSHTKRTMTYPFQHLTSDVLALNRVQVTVVLRELRKDVTRTQC